MVDFQERDTRRGLGDRAERLGSSKSADDDPDEGTGHEEEERGDDHGHDGDQDHHAHDVGTLGVAVVTVSSSRTLDADPSGDAVAAAFRDAGHEVSTRELVPDAYDRVQDVVGAVVGRGDVDVVVTTGGTGVTPDDVTVEAVEPLLEKTLPGFGELFRRRSEDQIGTRVVATRATGGIADGVPVFCLPGSEAAVRLGVSEIVLPEAGHLAGLARRDEAEE